MNEQPGFYKKDKYEILFSTFVCGDGYCMSVEGKDSYDYPVDGWVYADNLDSAIQILAQLQDTQSTPYTVQPEGYQLATDRNAETEFSKLVLLLNLSLQQNKILPTTEITIWDHNSLQHTITVERFMEVVVDYGLFCYALRSN